MKKQKKRILQLIMTVCFLLMLWNFGRVLGQQQYAVPENPIVGTNRASSQVLWSGRGYYTDDAGAEKKNGKTAARVLETETETETETPTEEQTELETEIVTELVTEYVTEIQTEWSEVPVQEPSGKQETLPQQSDTVYYEDPLPGEGGAIQPSADDDVSQEGAEAPKEDETSPETEADPEAGKYPVIASDLTDGETVAGSYRTFYIRAVDYKETYIAAGSLAVSGNGEKLYSTSDLGDMVAYRLELAEGANTIVITATDAEGRSASVSYTIYRGEDVQIPAGSITFSLEATTVGLGYLIGPSSEVFYEGEQLSYVLDRVLQQHGYTYRYDGSLTNGFYLKHVIRPGITSGCEIPADLEAKLLEVNCPQESYHLDSLGEFDFTKNSGWMYQVNGVHMNSGISTYYPADGDVVRIRFSLYGGSDIGGGMSGETWGDW